MTDKELLDLAAKAAGYEVHGYYSCTDEQGRTSEFALDIGETATVLWNPLTDDGDALRLAVNLEIEVSTHSGEASVFFFDSTGPHALGEKINSDAYAATRRAIVRAAAEIGKGM